MDYNKFISCDCGINNLKVIVKILTSNCWASFVANICPSRMSRINCKTASVASETYVKNLPVKNGF